MLLGITNDKYQWTDWRLAHYFDSFLARKLISEVTELLRDHHPLESLQDLDESELEDVKVTR